MRAENNRAVIGNFFKRFDYVKPLVLNCTDNALIMNYFTQHISIFGLAHSGINGVLYAHAKAAVLCKYNLHLTFLFYLTRRVNLAVHFKHFLFQ